MLSLSKREIPPHLLRFFRPRHIYKPKDDLMIPHRVYDAMMADGWHGRSDIVWNKPSCMPESVRDRPTRSHEYIFLLTKQARYYWDAEAVAESSASPGRIPGGNHKVDASRNDASRDMSIPVATTRNCRSVWTIATQPFSAKGLGNGYVESDDEETDHFAAFPPELVERCVKAGSSEKGACPACGAPYRRVVERGGLAGEAVIQQTERPAASVRDVSPSSLLRTNGRTWREKETVGWQPGCRCENAGDPVPCVILDPFSGSGTTCLVSERLGRDSIGVDLSPAYIEMSRKRIVGDAPLFTTVAVE